MILAIVQARMASTRLPGKVLKPILGRPMLSRLLERLAACPSVSKVVVATTKNPSDDELAAFLAREGVAVFRGSESDVLDRFYQCAVEQGSPELVVRVTADDPLKDPGVIERAIGELRADPSLDYCSNTMKPTFPEGIDIEVFRFSALERAHREATAPSDREHVTPYIWNRPDSFSVRNFLYEGGDLSSWRLTVDKPADFALITKIFEELYPKNRLFSLGEIVRFLQNNSRLLEMNAGTIRNEGYLKSLKEEGK